MPIITEKNQKEMKGRGFKTCHNKGFHIRFKNGWTVSVQFGWGNYCENYNNDVIEMRDFGKHSYASNTAEVWAWDSKGNHLTEDPLGYQTPQDVLKYMNKVSKKRGVTK